MTKAELLKRFENLESIMISEADKTLEGFVNILFINLFLVAYLIKNIMQMVIAKRNIPNFKIFGFLDSDHRISSTIILPEFLLNLLQASLTVYSI